MGEARPLSDLVSVHNRYARSVHLQRDYHTAGSGDYYLTASGLELLREVVIALEHPAERAMTVVGPYGAGKSAFCVFLSNLLEGRLPECDPPAQLDGESLATLHQARNARLVAIPIVGARTPLGPALIRGLLNGLEEGGYPALRAETNAQAQRLLKEPAVSPRQVADLYLHVAQRVCEHGMGGVLLMLDELGKFLEYAALHPREGDVFFLQELAEAAARSGKTPLLVLGVLHQNAEAYAQKLGRAQQAEWTKVGERFRSLPFFPSDPERIELIGRVLQRRPELELDGHVTRLCRGYESLELPAPVQRFAEASHAAYPLHPLTLIACPAYH